MEFRKKRGRRSHVLNLTPLIDVLLLLLIFFMVTSTFVETPAIEFKLPRVSEAGTARMSPTVIVVDADGGIYVEGRQVDVEALRDYLERARVTDEPESSLVVKVHRDARYERVVQVMSLASASGFDRIQSAVVRQENVSE